ncbi:MAG: protein kinase domain-containing protein [Planctomycetota bacterium]
MNRDDEFATTPSPVDPSHKDPTQAEPSSDHTNSRTEDFRTSANDPDGTFDGPQQNTKHVGAVEIPSTKLPKKIGRYEIKKLLGRGGFGSVYLAQDEQLKRDVAIKLNLSSNASSDAVKMFLAEAQILAELDHPNIVPVYDLGTHERDVYIVSKLVDGTDLATRIKKNRPDRTLSLTIVATIADALQCAHAKGLIHRDIKPANILLDKSDRPYLADFGIALRESDYVGSMEMAGTPAYMSPEQARGEGHLMTHQSDIYSLGVVLYELLSGRRPFQAKSAYELLKLVKTTEVRTPRTYDSNIPTDLERVCMKALARRPSDRFAIAKDFADELRYFLVNHTDSKSAGRAPSSAFSDSVPTSQRDQQPSSKSIETPTSIPRVVPKGLRSFDESDSDFFPELLPGPFDRTGTPEGLRFWKSRIEAQQTFRVGLVYGPSGCGKSSLIKAGLLPRLSSKIASIYIEATQEETTAKLLNEIQRRIPEVAGRSLSDALSFIRRRKLIPAGGKLLLVIDQFEQWLYANKNYAQSALTDALRQCDGESIQAILMVRDDFWLSVSRFLRELDIPIVERENSAMIDLFDLNHAQKVLVLFGRAYNKLPEDPRNYSEDQQQFIEQAVRELSQDDKVISVRLALFCEMMKSKPWTLKTLADLGGMSGVGVTFLEETFGDKHIPIQYRQHQEGVRGLLDALIPATGANIKGHSRELRELRKVAGYEGRPKEFAELVHLLDKNLHLITPVDSLEETSEETREYQLTHDYLVPSLREWLTRKQRETKQGRAELKLAERAAIWGSNKENKQLPTLLEWFQIRRWTHSSKWKDSERALMKKAGAVHLRNWGSLLLILSLTAGGIGYAFYQQDVEGRKTKAQAFMDSLKTASGLSVPEMIMRLKELKLEEFVSTELANRYQSEADVGKKLSLAFGLASFGRVDTDFIASQVDTLEYQDTENYIAALRNDTEGSIKALQLAAHKRNTPEFQKSKARLALVALALGDTQLPIDATEFEGRQDQGVRTWFIEEIPKWILDVDTLIKTVENSKSPALRSAFCLGLGQMPIRAISKAEDSVAHMTTSWYSLPDSSTHSAVAWLMQKLGIKEPEFKDSDQVVDGRNWYVNSQGTTFIRVVPKIPDPLVQLQDKLWELQKKPPEQKTGLDYQHSLGITLYQTGQYKEALIEFENILEQKKSSTKFAPDSTFDKDNSTEHIYEEVRIYHLLCLARLNNQEKANLELSQCIASGSVPSFRQYIECVVPLWLGQKELAVQRLQESLNASGIQEADAVYNLACASAQFASDASFTNEEKRVWVDHAIRLLERCCEINKDFKKQLVTDPDLRILHGSPRFKKLFSKVQAVNPYWLSKNEVTRAEFESFTKDQDYQGEKPVNRIEGKLVGYREVSPTELHPVQNVTWFDAVMYCNWLSAREKLKPFYVLSGTEEIKEGGNNERIVSKWKVDDSADGYRLPFEFEWEYACRSDSKTNWCFGSVSSFLPNYCQMFPSESSSVCGAKLPNGFGFHDMHGNLYEWAGDIMYDGKNPKRVACGGSWRSGPQACIPSERQSTTPDFLGFQLGFRVARNIPNASVQTP